MAHIRDVSTSLLLPTTNTPTTMLPSQYWTAMFPSQGLAPRAKLHQIYFKGRGRPTQLWVLISGACGGSLYSCPRCVPTDSRSRSWEDQDLVRLHWSGVHSHLLPQCLSGNQRTGTCLRCKPRVGVAQLQPFSGSLNSYPAVPRACPTRLGLDRPTDRRLSRRAATIMILFLLPG